MNVLIAGYNGYLGSRIGKYLKSKDFKIYKYIPKRENKLPERLDIIINVCGPNSQYCSKYPEKTKFIRKKITKKLLELTKNFHTCRFIYISTIHVYKKSKFIHENSSLNKSNPYAISHINGEKEILKFKTRNKKIDLKILRVSNCIGSPIKKSSSCWTLIANNLCKDLIRNNVITIRSKINEFRDFISISDLCYVIYFFINQKVTNRIIFNISSEKSISILNLSKIIQKKYKRLFHFKPKILHKALSKGFEYKISNKKFKKIKKIFRFDAFKEINDLLINCDKWFSNKKNK